MNGSRASGYAVLRMSIREHIYAVLYSVLDRNEKPVPRAGLIEDSGANFFVPGSYPITSKPQPDSFSDVGLADTVIDSERSELECRRYRLHPLPRTVTPYLSIVHLQNVPDLDGLLAQAHFIKVVGSTQLLNQR